MSANKPTFVIEEDNNRQTYEFVLDKKGTPIKLGDGSYGVVFLVRCGEEDMAAKLYYSDLSRSSTNMAALTVTVIDRFSKKFQLKPRSDKRVLALKELAQTFTTLMSLSELAVALRELESNDKLELSDEEYSFILEECQRTSDASDELRYLHERNSANTIRKKLRELGRGEAFTGVINIMAGTTEFRSSDAFKVLEKKFIEAQIKVSNFAMVMPVYQFTLKDLLERRTGNFMIPTSATKDVSGLAGSSTTHLQSVINRVFPSREKLIEKINAMEDLSNNALKDKLIADIHELNGYDLLKMMGYRDRISTMLPYLLDISQGLMALHLANKFHYDMKPANIFVRLRGQKVESVIGDLGFFMVQEYQDQKTYNTSVRDSLPLGTRHYRSPEQKDYFDICDVEIDENGDLIIRDPKFADTIIEVGDYVVFSKDSTREKYYIESIEKLSEWEKVKLLRKNPSSMPLQPDPRTQAVFFKQQKLRTDLFGFGAIVFDMLTGGKSPERFYDKIRAFDKSNESVARIMDSYHQVSTYQVTEPGLIHVFSDFKIDEQAVYAPNEIVELVLKCMLYKAEGTFYRTHSDTRTDKEEYFHAMNEVFIKLKNLLDDVQYHSNALQNHLIEKTYPGYDGPRQSNYLEDKILELQDRSIDKLPQQFANGIWYFRKLVDLLIETLENKETRFFQEILPKNVIIENDRLNFLFTAYQSEEHYKNDLRKDLVYAKINRDITNPFVPNYITFIRRKIQLQPVQFSDMKSSESGDMDIPEPNTFKYRFLDSALLGDSIEIGDWVIVKFKLCKIISISPEQQTVTLEYDLPSLQRETIIPGSDEQQSLATEHIFYKNLDPCKYYLQMLGIYLYHIFFVGLRDISQDKPLLITIAQSIRYLNIWQNDDVVKINEQDANLASKKDPDIEDIYRFIRYMFMKLTFPEHANSYYMMKGTDKKRIVNVANDVGELQRLMANFLKVLPAELNRLKTSFTADELQAIKHKLNEVNMTNIDFEKLVSESISILSHSGLQIAKQASKLSGEVAGSIQSLFSKGKSMVKDTISSLNQEKEKIKEKTKEKENVS